MISIQISLFLYYIYICIFLKKFTIHRGCGGVETGEVAVQGHGGVGEGDGVRPRKHAGRVEPSGEEYELDVGAEVDHVEGHGAAARLDRALPRRAFPALLLAAGQVGRVLTHVLRLQPQQSLLGETTVILGTNLNVIKH